jgi:hypothetical protein
VTEFEKNAREKEEGLKQCKADRDEKSTAMKEWKELGEARKARNKVIREEHTVRLKAWEAETLQNQSIGGPIGRSQH